MQCVEEGVPRVLIAAQGQGSVRVGGGHSECGKAQRQGGWGTGS